MTVQQLIDFLTRQDELNPSFKDTALFVQYGGEINGIGFGDSRCVLTHDYYPEHSERSGWANFQSCFQLAGIQIINYWELTNPYWPRCYTNTILEEPWWLVQTPFGLVKIGWRKRVINIDWSATQVRVIVTEDDVTKSETNVHAYIFPKAIEYLTSLKQCAEKVAQLV